MVEWENAVQVWSTIDFTDLAIDEVVSDQYVESFGVAFENGVVFAGESKFGFPRDGRGFFASQGSLGSQVDVVFDTPIRAFAADHPGTFEYTLFSGDDLVFGPVTVGGGTSRFTGVISEVAFDRMRVSDSDGFAVDDIRFGLVVPGPGATLLLAAGCFAIAPGRRRRI